MSQQKPASSPFIRTNLQNNQPASIPLSQKQAQQQLRYSQDAGRVIVEEPKVEDPWPQEEQQQQQPGQLSCGCGGDPGDIHFGVVQVGKAKKENWGRPYASCKACSFQNEDGSYGGGAFLFTDDPWDWHQGVLPCKGTQAEKQFNAKKFGGGGGGAARKAPPKASSTTPYSRPAPVAVPVEPDPVAKLWAPVNTKFQEKMKQVPHEVDEAMMLIYLTGMANDISTFAINRIKLFLPKEEEMNDGLDEAGSF